MPTTIEIHDQDWSRLNARKEQGDGFKDVVGRLLDQLEQIEDSGLQDDINQDPGPDQELGRPATSTSAQTGGKETSRDPRAAQMDSRAAESDQGASVGAVDLPGGSNVSEARRDALREAVALIEARGGARASDIRAAIHKEHDTGYDSARSLWKNCLQPALAEIEEVELWDRHDGIWQPTEDVDE